MFQSLDEIENFFNERRKIGVKPGLERVTFMLKKIGHPEQQLQAIHVAGTNGKGSTIQFLKNALVANEYKVGLFTSPSFTGICGHFFINNKQMTEKDLIYCMNKLLPIIKILDDKHMHPTEFEIITVIAFIYFKNKVDIAVIETGMGGRYDTTNCFSPIVAIITNVATDHEEFLGETIEEITSHKAGIMKRNRPVVVGKVNEVSEKVIKKEAEIMQAPIYVLHKDFTYKQRNDVKTFLYSNDLSLIFTLQMQGLHQIENASLALMALYLLQKEGFAINWKYVTTSLTNTTLPGRFEIIHERPTIILDSAHNVAGIEAFLQTVEHTYKHEEKHVLFAAFKDKQLSEMLQRLQGEFSTIKLTTFAHERAAKIDELLPLICKESMQLQVDWKKAIEDILHKSHSENDIYFVTGSLHFITLVRKFIV